MTNLEKEQELINFYTPDCPKIQIRVCDQFMWPITVELIYRHRSLEEILYDCTFVKGSEISTTLFYVTEYQAYLKTDSVEIAKSFLPIFKSFNN